MRTPQRRDRTFIAATSVGQRPGTAAGHVTYSRAADDYQMHFNDDGLDGDAVAGDLRYSLVVNGDVTGRGETASLATGSTWTSSRSSRSCRTQRPAWRRSARR